MRNAEGEARFAAALDGRKTRGSKEFGRVIEVGSFRKHELEREKSRQFNSFTIASGDKRKY